MKLTRTNLLSSTLLALALATPVLAQSTPPTTPPAPGGGGGGPRPGGEGGGRKPNWEKFAEKNDKNKDGFVSEDEVTADQWKRLKALDTNGDGKISKEEFEKGPPMSPRGPRPGGDGPKPGGDGPKPGSPTPPPPPPAPKA